MNSAKWYAFDPAKGSRQKRPPIRRYVLVQLPERPSQGLPPAVAVGYRKDSGGDKQSPFFVTPGVGGIPTHWCDCLGDDFQAPLWPGKQVNVKKAIV